MKKNYLCIVYFLFIPLVVLSKDFDLSGKSRLSKAMLLDDHWMNANRMNGVLRNNGTWFFDNAASNWGLEWPKGSGLSPIYAAGQYISTRIDGQVRVAGVQHSATEFQPGVILSTDNADDPRHPKYQWYVITTGKGGDWTNWPVDQGAPVDNNGDPLLMGDMTAFSVWNDLADHSEYGTEKLNVEVRQLVWQFNRIDPVGDMTFIKWQLVNKSGVAWDSTFFSIWLDPDLGDGADDLVGCDSLLGLAYCYNSDNYDGDYGLDFGRNYGKAPPAVGVDFLQGPLVDSPGNSVTLPNGSVLINKKMLNMTGFVFYNGDDSPRGNPSSGQDVWNFQRGYWRDGNPILDPDGHHNPFMFNGDPVADTGWLDSNAADRRLLMTTGPFTMPNWVDDNGDGIPQFGEPGVQEIVAGVIAARGTSNLNSVSQLKIIDNLAQAAYENNFILGGPPLPPDVQVSESENKIVLTWQGESEYNADGDLYASVDPIVKQAMGDTVIMDNTIKIVTDDEYNFYGYSVYQYSDANGSNPVLVQSWNNGGSIDAEPYAGPRHIVLTENKNRIVGEIGQHLINGKEYYYGVVAEGYLEFGSPVILGSAVNVLTVTPQNIPGLRLTSAQGDSLHVTKTGNSDGSTVALVVDPAVTTGMEYTINFNEDLTWNLAREDGAILAESVSNQSDNDAYNVYDGILVKVLGPQPGINTQIPGPFGDYPGYNGWDYGPTTQNRWLSFGPYDFDLGTWGGSLGNGFAFWGSSLRPAGYTDVRLDFAGGNIDEDPDRWSRAFVYREDKDYAFEGMGDFPAVAWDISDPNNPRRLNICFVEKDGVPWTVDPEIIVPANNIWDMGWFSDADTSAYAQDSGNECFFIMASDYNPNSSAYSAESNIYYDANEMDVMYAGWVYGRGSYTYLQDRWWLELYASKVNDPSVTYAFTAPASTAATTSTLKEDLVNINIVPNPYYRFLSDNSYATSRRVQFTCLPRQVTIKIFDIAGNLVRTLEKDDETTLMRWDLHNAYDLPVASGVYICHH